MSRAREWAPVLEGEDAERAERIIGRIAEALAPEALAGGDDASFATGLVGPALFHAQRHAVDPRAGHDLVAARLLDTAVEQSASIADSPSFFSGITGLAWTVQHLRAIADPGLVESIDDVEAALVSALDDEPHPIAFDLTNGLVGLGIFALERGESPRSLAALGRMVDWLEAGAEASVDGVSWRAGPESLDAKSLVEFPEGCHYTGVAHGTAGVAGFLAGLVEAGVERERARHLLGGALHWVLAQQQEGVGALFPFQSIGRGTRPPSRSAWCTGGPGISLMLWRAGRAAGVASWEASGIALARDAMRRPMEEMGVRDACFCHGTAGLGHLYTRWYHATGDERFRDEAVTWFRRTFDEQRAGEGIAGYSAVNVPRGRREAATGILFGAAGIGLSLLAATSTVVPRWDAAFLLSAPDLRRFDEAARGTELDPAHLLGRT